MLRPQWWKVAFSTLTRCEGSPGWQLTRCVVPTVLRGAESIRRMIYRARAGRTFFCSYFFCILGEGFSVGFENYYVVGLWYTFAKKKHVFLKKRAKIELGVTPSRALSLYFLGDLTLLYIVANNP